MSSPVPWNFQPGIQRDGTRFAGKAYSDGLWCRWDRGLPRKIGGYQLISADFAGTPRSLNIYAAGNFTYFTVGEASLLEAINIDNSGGISAIYDRTPVGFAADPGNTWQFDLIYDSAGTETVLVAFAAPNLTSLYSEVACPYYIGGASATSALVAVAGSDVSGGIVVLQPYTFRYGTSLLAWSDANLPDTLVGGDAGEARVTGLKIIKGLPLRGNGVGPAGLFWSLNSLIRATYNGGTTIFAFDTISDDISVLSADCIVEMDGIYYWTGVDRFQMFNGVVREIPNTMNKNFFFDNLNQTEHEKVFALKVPRYGEIWWFFPKGDSTECNWAIIFNVREGYWYDTPAPPDFRSCAAYAQVFHYPVMGSDYTGPEGLRHCLWQHATGTDLVYKTQTSAIRSYFETSNFSLLDAGKNNDMVLAMVEWDAVQSGDISLVALCQQNARSPQYESDPQVLIEDNGRLTADEQVARFKITTRNVSFRAESNVAGGDYQLGNVIMQITDQGGERITQ